MKILRLALIALSLFSFNIYANVPTDQSIRTLLKNMGHESSLEQMRQDMEQNMNSLVSSINTQMSASDKQKVKDTINKVTPIIMNEMTWAKLEPHLIKAVRNTYTQEEVNAQIDFFNTPIGKSIASKNGTYMMNSLKANQEFQIQIQPKLMEAMMQLQQQ